ncbi:MAG: hypothetical protein QOJ15_10776 [Bradyrhizobium sp.]|nr:hypothetical protein [Bradyrhizobium sp.]
MTNPNDLDAALALSRFGLGAREGSIASIAQNPRGALKDEVTGRVLLTPAGRELRLTSDLLVDLYAFLKDLNIQRSRQAASGTGTPAAQPPAMNPGSTEQKPSSPNLPQRVFLAEVDARFNGTIREPVIGIVERLAIFGPNHFAVAVGKGPVVRILAGAYEREAIRPHVFGLFEDMLLAVETHPAMLFFLDNRQSVGPDSKASGHGKRGLNENLAREIMELHTLGVDGGYMQRDVTSLSRIITGWTVVGAEGRLGTPGTFAFNHAAHEPGSQTLLGISYPDDGVGQGRAALRDLAHHPATARHIALKLARHFVADAPPPDLVASLAATYTKTRGDLSAVYLTLIGSEAAWNPTLVKIRSPLEYFVALLRASGERPKPNAVMAALNAMGQPLWNPSGPNGFPDTVDAWASSEGLGTRIDVASLVANQTPGRTDPRRFATETLGSLLSPDTQHAISRAETKAQAVSIAFLSPEFQRR